MEEFRIDAPVLCTDGSAGKVYALIVNPVKEEMTHLVVKEPGRRDVERVVSLELVTMATHDEVRLACTLAEFKSCDSFLQKRYIESRQPDYVAMQMGQYIAPYMTLADKTHRSVTEEAIPHGELAVHRGAVVDALDGHVGHVGEFVVEEATGHITHIVLEKGHLWAKREIAVPIDQVSIFEANKVHLTLNKAAVSALPTLELSRKY